VRSSLMEAKEMPRKGLFTVQRTYRRAANLPWKVEYDKTAY